RELLADGQPAVIVADASLLPAIDSEAPVLLMVDLDNPADTSARPSGIHDCITKPPVPRELVHRASALIDLVARRTASRQGAEALREQLRLVSAAVRATND
ncbi:hypothetical protein, partial [Escherichia coli]|uniref:hypothetical protein n=1 Tax=Escherichia coli TaxID=562 RepID=UPI0032E4F72E